MILRLSLAIIAVLMIGLIGFSYYVSQPVVEGSREAFAPQIADPIDALTLARTDDGLMIVRTHEGDAITGIALQPIIGDAAKGDLFAALPLIASVELSAQPTRRYSLQDLRTPFTSTYPHIAAGTNFKEHADEIYSDDPPFLFPKLVQATAWNHPVTFVDRLDFEAEVCTFPVSDITDADQLPTMGLILCNDFTDRWTLINDIDLSQPLGLTGFAAGKGCQQCLPTGYLVVIPHNDEFYRTLGVQLYVNDQLRQSFNMREMILSIPDIITQAWQNAATQYENRGDSVPLLPGKTIARGTLVLTGTGAGVLFRPANIWNQGFYLQPGDVVWTQATYLGHLRNEITQ